MISLMFPSTPRASWNPDDERIWSPSIRSPRTKAGIDVNEDSALTYSAVFRCSRLLSETPSGLPLRCFKRMGKDREPASIADVPAIEHVSVSPNPNMTAGVFREGRILHQVNWGNGFAEIVRDRFGRVQALWPIHPSRVTLAEPGSGYYYAVMNGDGLKVGLRREQMLHVCGTLSNDGIWGCGVIRHARENIGGAMAVEKHGAEYFGSGGQPKGVFVVPGQWTAATKDQFLREMQEALTGSAKAIMLPPTSEYKPVDVSNEDAQFIDTQVRNEDMVGIWYGVPGHMLSKRVLGGSIEALSAEFIIYSLYPWVSKYEQQLNFKLLDRSQWNEYYFEHDFSALLRGSIIDRLNAYRVGICTGIYTINECRRFENLPSIGPAGDVHYVPANLFTADQMEHGNPSGTVGPGSDHSGAPADNPLDHMPQAERLTPAQALMLIHDLPNLDPQTQFERWRRGMSTIVADEVGQQMRSFERSLEDRPHEWREVARSALQDALSRSFTKEANAAARATKGDFDRWLREFYGEHEPQLAGWLKTACQALGLAGVKKWTKQPELAAWLRDRSVEALRSSYDNDTPEVFARKLAEWPTKRAADVAEEVLRG